MSDIIPLLTNENARRVAEDILTSFETKGNNENVDHDYRMKGGVMERQSIKNPEILKALNQLHGKEVPAPNTWFSFDTELDSMLGYLKDTVCKKIDNDTITTPEIESIQEFIKKIITLVNTDEQLLSRLRNIVRKIVTNDADPVVFPLKDCRLILFEFGAKEDYGDMIKVLNYRRVNRATGEFVGEKNNISKDLLDRRRAVGFQRNQDTHAIYAKIINEQRAAGNPNYLDTLPQDVEIVSEARECHLDIFADYSPIDQEELVAKIVAANNAEKSADG